MLKKILLILCIIFLFSMNCYSTEQIENNHTIEFMQKYYDTDIEKYKSTFGEIRKFDKEKCDWYTTATWWHIYTFKGVVVYLQKGDFLCLRILKIMRDDVYTEKGISCGQTLDQLKKAYENELEEETEQSLYDARNNISRYYIQYGAATINFVVKDDKIISIEYNACDI